MDAADSGKNDREQQHRQPARRRNMPSFIARHNALPFPYRNSLSPAHGQRRDAVICLLLLRVDAATLAVFAHALEADNAVRQRKQRVVRADADTGAGMDVGAALTHQNIARQHKLPVGTLDAQSLRLGITAVFRGTNALFMGK